MVKLGLPVPPGFTITTEACRAYLATGAVPEGLDDEIAEHLAALEEARGKKLGDPDDPLLVSVRSGAKFSMPGMMETVLNIGLNDASRARPRRPVGQRALRVGLLPPADPDVRQDGASTSTVSGSSTPWTRPSARKGVDGRPGPRRGRPAGARRRRSRRSSREHDRARSSRRTRASS